MQFVRQMLDQKNLGYFGCLISRISEKNGMKLKVPKLNNKIKF